MIVHPQQAHQRRSISAHPCDADILAARVERLLAKTDGQTGKAMRALVWRLSVHPSQEVGRLRYTELSIGYLAKAADVGWETARRAWHLVRQALGWTATPIARVRDLGVRVRALRPGGKWGQHLLLTGPCSSAVDSVSERLELGPVHHGEPTGPDWKVITKFKTRGRHRMACCPWHDDKNPSMLLNVNEDGESGSGVCFSCVDDQGQPLRVYWREYAGTISARLARSVSTSEPAIRGMGTIENLPIAAAGPGAFLLATYAPDTGMRRRASKCVDLVDLMRRSDKRSQRDGSWAEALRDTASGEGLGQSYVSVDPMRPTAWRKFETQRGTVRVPTRWEPTAVQWVLSDLDGFDGAPMSDEGLEVAGAALERWATGQPLLSGRVCVVRTSHRGVQVAVELATQRGAPRGWYATGEAKALCAALDVASMTSARAAGFTGGHADQAVHAAGRLMRRPGWRTDKAGDMYRSRLVWGSSK